jgi:xylan 1,4-beta-xylosidase
VDASRPLGTLPPIWRFFGADEPNYGSMKDGRKLLAWLGELAPHRVYFRTHNLMTSGDGTPALKWGSTNLYAEDAQGRPVYDFTIVDRLFETYLARGVRPYVQLGFMPKPLSSKPEPYQHEWRPGLPYELIYTGWAYPPTDFQKWGEVVYQWAKHCVDKWGRDEVASWYWETWNEANIGYWRGTREEFYRLHDTAVAAVRRALPNARVGGPEMAGSDPAYLKAFLDHTTRATRLDFVSFHAKGAPRFVDGHVQMGIAAQLRTIDQAFATIAGFPEYRATPIVIGESDPEGCAACQGPQLAYRNGTMYSSYTAAVFARKHELARKHGVHLEGALTWAFEFEDQPYFAGFRALASNGLPLAVLNVFRIFSKLGPEQVEATSSGAIPLATMLSDGVRGSADVSVLASRAPGRLSVMAWHYHDDDLPGPDADVTLALAGIAPSADYATLTHYRVDDERSNAYAAWQGMGQPIAPTAAQYAALQKASQLQTLEDREAVKLTGGAATLRFRLPRRAVSLLEVEWR